MIKNVLAGHFRSLSDEIVRIVVWQTSFITRSTSSDLVWQTIFVHISKMVSEIKPQSD